MVGLGSKPASSVKFFLHCKVAERSKNQVERKRGGKREERDKQVSIEQD